MVTTRKKALLAQAEQVELAELTPEEAAALLDVPKLDAAAAEVRPAREPRHARCSAQGVRGRLREC